RPGRGSVRGGVGSGARDVSGASDRLCAGESRRLTFHLYEMRPRSIPNTTKASGRVGELRLVPGLPPAGLRGGRGTAGAASGRPARALARRHRPPLGVMGELPEAHPLAEALAHATVQATDSSGNGDSSRSASGAKSAPFGQTTVRQTGST